MTKPVILCVDDESLVLENLEVELKKSLGNQYIYEFAESAEEALEIIDELTDDGVKVVVVVSDWLMPGMKGDEFLIQVHKKRPQIIKILLTGQADEAAVERAKQEAHLHRCIYKPWNSKDLIGTIQDSILKHGQSNNSMH